MKLIEKQRNGARVKKRYDRAQTPYQRVIASAYLTKRKRERIESLYRKLDPVTLLKELEQRQDHFGTFANGTKGTGGERLPQRDGCCRQEVSCRDHRFTRTQWDQKVSADEKAPDLEDPKGSLC